MVFTQIFTHIFTYPKWVTLIVSGIVIYIVKRVLSAPKKPDNFFEKSSIKPPGPIITDRNAKKKILKQRM